MSSPQNHKKISSNVLLKLFHEAVENVPAYADFIASHNLDSAQIKHASDLTQIPIMDKDNYLKKYPLQTRMKKGFALHDAYMITASSGTTSVPTFWPRDYEIDLTLEKKKEALYDHHFHISEKKTLCILTFALGMWTAGMLTAKLSWAAAKNNNMTVVTPGMKKEIINKLLDELSPFYDQVIILGYPPFLISLFQYLEEQKFDFLKQQINVMYTAEALTHKGRQYIANLLSKDGSFKHVTGFYASSEVGITAAETQILTEINQGLFSDAKASMALFGEQRPHTLYAYDPSAKYMEEENGELLVSVDQPVPLIRYNTHDRGGLLEKAELQKALALNDISNRENLPEHTLFVRGRSNAVVMTANIYIDDVKFCIERSTIFHKLTGYFKFGVTEAENLKKQLKVLIYLKKNMSLSEEEISSFKDEFFDNLFSVNADLAGLKNDADYLATINPFEIDFIHESEEHFTGIKLEYFL